MHLTSYPSFKGENQDWLGQLQAGNASLLRASLERADTVSIFKAGMASAERGLLGGVQAALHALEIQGKTDFLQSMGRHWVEASIFSENYKVANYLRALAVDPMIERDRSKEEFAGASFNSRRIVRIDECLNQIEAWSDEFIEQFTSSQLLGSSLFRAIHHHPLKTVASLIALGARPNTVSEGYHPLWAAVRAGKAPVLEMLFEAGASIEDAGMHVKKTLLVAAAEKGLEPCVLVLLKNGASLSDRSCGIDAPHAARSAGHVQLASKLEANVLSLAPPAPALSPSRRL